MICIPLRTFINKNSQYKRRSQNQFLTVGAGEGGEQAAAQGLLEGSQPKQEPDLSHRAQVLWVGEPMRGDQLLLALSTLTSPSSPAKHRSQVLLMLFQHINLPLKPPALGHLNAPATESFGSMAPSPY